MLNHIAKHIAKNNILIREQHGFRNYPSGVCQKNKKDSHHATLCDKCELWFHTDCQEFHVYNYLNLLNLNSFCWALIVFPLIGSS